MIKKENIRITVTVPKYVIEELKRKYNYNFSHLITILLTNHLIYKNNIYSHDNEAIKKDLKKYGFENIEDFNKTAKELFYYLEQN